MTMREAPADGGRSASAWTGSVRTVPGYRRHFYRSCRKVSKQWRARGIDPGQLFVAALNDPKALRDLIKQASNDKNAQLLRDVAAELQDADMKGLICGFLNAAWKEGNCSITPRSARGPAALVAGVD